MILPHLYKYKSTAVNHKKKKRRLTVVVVHGLIFFFLPIGLAIFKLRDFIWIRLGIKNLKGNLFRWDVNPKVQKVR